MSSFVGHGLVAAAVAAARRRAQPSRGVWLGWTAWLVAVAWFPDLDYAVPALRSGAHDGARVTHSLTFALLLPAVTCLALAIAGIRARRLADLTLQAVGAGVSHVVLDFLVGVTPQALFWPISDVAVAAPVGVLPSAGTPSPANPHFLRNLAIELGVLVPLLACLAPWRGRAAHPVLTAALLACSVTCMAVAASLPR
jgi:membrane-bound metal-dependent hydrolase YbcI (DUF457 family)